MAADNPKTKTEEARLSLPIPLVVGAITESVRVNAQSATLQTDSAEVRSQLQTKSLEELPVPGKKYGFGVCEAAQAEGNRARLSECKRRALCIHLGADLKSGLQSLQRAFDGALADHPPAGPES